MSPYQVQSQGAVRGTRRLRIVSLAALLLLVFAVAIWSYFRFSKAQTTFDSVAVLPFVNVSGDKEAEFLSDGISETLINKLTKLRAFRVTARTTAFHYKGKDTVPQQIGKELGVGAILTGTVLQRDDILQIQVDLIDTADGTQIWGEQYSSKESELLDVQEKIIREVSEHLRLKLSGEQEQQVTKRDTENAEAYKFYLKGRYYWNKRRNADNLRKAIEHFQQAVDKDPTYSLAYVGLADAYVLLEQYAGAPSVETFLKAIAYAQRALQIDSSLAEAHASLGYAYGNLWQWTEAEKHYKLSIELNPKYPTTRQWYCLYLRAMGQSDEALAQIKIAQELDPLSPAIQQNAVIVYLWKDDTTAVIEQAREMIELDSNYPLGHSFLGLGYLSQGRNDEALVELQKGVELSKDPKSPKGLSRPLSYLGYGYAVAGKKTEARAIIEYLEETYGKTETTGVYIAAVYAGLGEKDQAFAWLYKDLDKHNGLLPSIKWYPMFKSLRKDPRYADLLRKMGLPY
jgi:TolB-like protein/Flp pilus assembly protein TadD